MTQIPYKRVLSLDLTSRGFGFAVLEQPDSLLDWGVKQVKKDKQAGCLSLTARLMQLYQPEVLIVENCDAEGSKRCPRVKHLIEKLCEHAKERGIESCRVSPNTVRSVFSPVGADTKYAIAKIIAGRIPELAFRLPPIRKAWMSEDYRMSFFDAVAFALTYYYLIKQMNESLFENHRHNQF